MPADGEIREADITIEKPKMPPAPKPRYAETANERAVRRRGERIDAFSKVAIEAVGTRALKKIKALWAENNEDTKLLCKAHRRAAKALIPLMKTHYTGRDGALTASRGELLSDYLHATGAVGVGMPREGFNEDFLIHISDLETGRIPNPSR